LGECDQHIQIPYVRTLSRSPSNRKNGNSMKSMNSRKKRIGLVAGVLLVVIATVVAVSSTLAVAQGGDFDNVVERLQEEGIPIEAATLEETQASFVLKSSSEANVGTPDDPIILDAVEREMFLAKNRGMEIDTFKWSMINAKGEELARAEIVLDQVMDPSWKESPALTEESAENSLKEEILTDAPLTGVSLDSAVVKSDPDGTRVLHLALSSANAKAANESWAAFMIQVNNMVAKKNALEKAQIGIVRIDLFDDAGNPLFKYVYDAQRGSHSWWQDPAMTTDWFESPS